jgi:hypothetical protein
VSDDDETPVEASAHPSNVPYIRALGGLTLQLSGLNSNFAAIVHELRVARKPMVENGLGARLRAAFKTLSAIGAAGEDTFRK